MLVYNWILIFHLVKKKSELIRPIPLCCYLMVMLDMLTIKKKISEYGQEIPQSQTADKPMTPQGRATKSQGTRKTNRAKQPAISSNKDDCKTRSDIKKRTTKHRTNTN